jgi:hypothetical protein
MDPTVVLPPAMVSTLQVTVLLPRLPVTVGVNCCVCVVAATAARTGEIVTVSTGAAIVRLMGVVGARVPEFPMTVSPADPIGATLLTVRVSTLVVEVLAGLNAAVTPVGKPDADMATLPLKPFCPTTVMVVLAVPPWPTLALAGTADNVNVGDGAGVELPPPQATSPMVPATPSPRQQRVRLRFIIALLFVCSTQFCSTEFDAPQPENAYFAGGCAGGG